MNGVECGEGILSVCGETLKSLSGVCVIIERNPEQLPALRSVLFCPLHPKFGNIERPRSILTQASVSDVRRLVNAVAHCILCSESVNLQPNSEPRSLLVNIVLAQPQVTPVAVADLMQKALSAVKGSDGDIHEKGFILCCCIRDIIQRQIHSAHRAELIRMLNTMYEPGRFYPMDAMMAAIGVSLTPRRFIVEE